MTVDRYLSQKYHGVEAERRELNVATGEVTIRSWRHGGPTRRVSGVLCPLKLVVVHPVHAVGCPEDVHVPTVGSVPKEGDQSGILIADRCRRSADVSTNVVQHIAACHSDSKAIAFATIWGRRHAASLLISDQRHVKGCRYIPTGVPKSLVHDNSPLLGAILCHAKDDIRGTIPPGKPWPPRPYTQPFEFRCG